MIKRGNVVCSAQGKGVEVVEEKRKREKKEAKNVIEKVEKRKRGKIQGVRGKNEGKLEIEKKEGWKRKRRRVEVKGNEIVSTG